MLISDIIYWNPDPEVFGLPIHWYGVLWGMSFIFGYFLFRKMFKLENVPEEWMESLAVYVFIGAIVGARMGQVLFYEPDYYFSHPAEIIKIWKGGLASHGGAIGLIIATYIFSRRVSKRSVLWVLDRLVIAVALAGMFIRLGNLMNSEIVGAPSDASWSFVFPRYDQNVPWMTGTYEDGQTVKLMLRPEEGRLPSTVRVMRTDGDSLWSEVGRITPTGMIEDGAYVFRDKVDGVAKYRQYSLEVLTQETATTVAGTDSAATSAITLLQGLSVDPKAFTGRMEGDSLRMRLLTPSHGGRVFIKVWRSDKGGPWRKVASSDIPVEMRGGHAEFADFVGDARDIRYRATELRMEYTSMKLIPRHPSQLYEAFCYLLIFLFLWWWYLRKGGKLPKGQIFGIFLVLLFTARFLIEFIKADQEAFEAGMALNMGQILSIPFILAGIWFLLRSRNREPVQGVDYGMPYTEEDSTPEN